MPDIPSSYDPSGRSGPHRLHLPGPGSATANPVFGRRTEPIKSASLEPICVEECRLVDFGGCCGKCRLMASPEKEEPRWPTPPTT